ncbi:hypothetical protein ACLOJK_039021 [Asimina triloba]
MKEAWSNQLVPDIGNARGNTVSLAQETSLQIQACIKKRGNLISQRNWARPTTTPSCLLLKEGRDHRLVKLLQIDCMGGESLDGSIHFNLNKKHSIYDSCNDFLLLGCTSQEDSGNKINYFIYNPISGCLVHDNIPPVYLPTYGISLVIRSCLWFSVYSSRYKKWEWKKLRAPLGYTEEFDARPPVLVKALFFKKATHWALAKHILIYHLRGKFCKAIELPILKPGHRCLWEFEATKSMYGSSKWKIRRTTLSMSSALSGSTSTAVCFHLLTQFL